MPGRRHSRAASSSGGPLPAPWGRGPRCCWGARPALLLADEPTGNVDPDIGQRLIRLFEELNRLGTTVLIATHDRGLIESTKAREMRLVDGRLVELRTAART